MKLYLDGEREFIQQLQTVDYMNYFIRQTSDCLEYGNVHPNYIQEEYYAILELHIEDLVFSTYITNYGPGDFCFSMKTGLDLSSFVHLYNKMEDEHLDFLQHQLPTFMNLVINTATKGSETSFFDKPFFNANDIVNEDICSWPIKYKILVLNLSIDKLVKIKKHENFEEYLNCKKQLFDNVFLKVLRILKELFQKFLKRVKGRALRKLSSGSVA